MTSGRLASQLLVSCLAAATLAGCSADASRVNNPFANPFDAASPVDRTSTAGIAASSRVKTAKVASSPLPPITAKANYATPATRSPAIAQSAPALPAPTATGSLARSGNWSAEGGTPIVVGHSETADALANRYGVPVQALLKTNGFTSSAQVKPGTRLIIPIYGAQTATPTRSAAVAPATTPLASPRPLVASRQEQVLRAPARKEPASTVAAAEPAKSIRKPALAKADPAASVTRKDVARAETSKPEPKIEPKTVAKAEPKVVAPKVAAVAPASAPAIDRSPTGSLPADPAPAAPDANSPEFRWPAHGRIIQGFKAGGNDGINIAVPEGTPVKAAEGGVVAYAGSELKGYGNLVLIRHPNGFVSAYANNGDIAVKRGEQVRRGQTIAKSGQTGNVASPQLHFELRKGSTPVDPTQYLAGL